MRRYQETGENYIKRSFVILYVGLASSNQGGLDGRWMNGQRQKWKMPTESWSVNQKSKCHLEDLSVKRVILLKETRKKKAMRLCAYASG
jgi:hypothetical protein